MEYVLRDSRGDTGSCLMFWRQGGGYTSDLSQAEEFDVARAQRMHDARDTDIPVPKEKLLEVSQVSVDMQYLPAECFSGVSEYVVQRVNEYDGNNIFFITENFTLSTDYRLAKIFTEDEVFIFLENNDGYRSFSRSEIDTITRITVVRDKVNAKHLAEQSGIKLMKPEKPIRKVYNCSSCGQFQSEADYYTGNCKNCDI